MILFPATFNSKIKPMSSDTHKLHAIVLDYFTKVLLYNIIILFDTVVRHKRNFKHKR